MVLENGIVHTLVTFAGLCLVLSGFFLTRRELQGKSECEVNIFSRLKFVIQLPLIVSLSLKVLSIHEDLDLPLLQTAASDSGCWMPKTYNRTFLFIIDALRYDFMKPSQCITSSNHKCGTYNQFQYMHELLHLNASQSMLFGFQGDPPTTTSQRLKALTTGSFPTFVDVGSNLNSAAVQEDNIIDQILKSTVFNHPKRRGKKNRLITMGDDTWSKLFPTQFDLQFPFDSFNTKV